MEDHASARIAGDCHKSGADSAENFTSWLAAHPESARHKDCLISAINGWRFSLAAVFFK